MGLISVDDLTKSFGDLTAVDSLSFEVGSGEIVGLLGANGAGKTTAMRMILGLLKPSSGTVAVNSQPFGRIDRSQMGYVPQGLGLYRDLTVAENLQFIASAFRVEVPPLGPAGLAAFADMRISEVSLGVRRRLAFLAAGCHDPSVLILDEPTSGVGPLGRARLWETIHETASSGAAVLVSTHYMDEAEECDRVVLLAGGREIVSGTVGDILAGVTAVEVKGEIPDDRIRIIEEEGGTAILTTEGYRIVGIGVDSVRHIAGIEADEVPANFEEVFVSVAS